MDKEQGDKTQLEIESPVPTATTLSTQFSMSDQLTISTHTVADHNELDQQEGAVEAIKAEVLANMDSIQSEMSDTPNIIQDNEHEVQSSKSPLNIPKPHDTIKEGIVNNERNVCMYDKPNKHMVESHTAPELLKDNKTIETSYEAAVHNISGVSALES